MKPKRKLTDLSPNEFIHLKAGTKEHKKIIKLAGFVSKPNYDIWVGNNQVGLYFQSNEIMAGSELPACEFLPSKKSTRKMVKELTKRIEALEKNKGLRTVTFSTNKDGVLTIEEQPFVLPENWCVKRDALNFSNLNNWANKINGRVDYNDSSPIYLYIEDGEIYGNVGDKPKGYTEITTEQFIKHVLKRDELPVTVNQVCGNDGGFEIGKWYKSSGGALNCKGDTCDYGFNSSGVWSYDNYWFNQEPNWKSVTNQEVESALLKYAKRTYTVGTKVKSIHPASMALPSKFVIKKTHVFNYNRNGNTIDVSEIGSCMNIFYNGKWAEIIDQPKEADLNIAGQNAKLIELINQTFLAINFVNGNKEAISKIISETQEKIKSLTLYNNK